jgi:hypothetical protein
MFAMTNEKCNRSRIISTFKIKLKITGTDFEPEKSMVDIRREHG